MWTYRQTTMDNDWLAHYGVKGQKRGVRRFQNDDGTLTQEGREHYGIGEKKAKKNSDTEYIELQNGKKLSMEKKGMYAYMNSGKQVGAHIREQARMTKTSAKSMSKERDLQSKLKDIATKREALAKKYGRMKYSDIDFYSLRSIEKQLDNEEGRILSEYIRRNKNDVRFKYSY